MGTIIKNTTSAFVDGQQITSAALNNLIDDAILNTTAVSAGTGLTVNASTGVLSMDTSLTGKTLTGGSLNNCPIGASTPSTGSFTTLSASGGYTGSVTGNVTGDVTGDVTGNLSGNVTGGTGAFTTLTASDDANFDSGTLFVDASANGVGIGTTSPAKKLEISSNANGQATADIPGIRIENTDTTVTDTNVAGEIEFFSKDSSEADKISGFIKNVAEDAGTKYALTFGAKATGANAAEAMRIDADGNVGIGTELPSYKLDINDDASTGAGLRVTGGGGGGPLATFTRDVISAGTVEIGAANGDPQIQFTSASDNWSIGLDSTVFNICDGSEVGANQRLVIDTAGNVGIGTTTPGAILQTSTAENMVASFKSTDPTAYVQIIDSVDATYIGSQSGIGFIGGSASASSNNINIDLSNGNVGIGATSPDGKLVVAGAGSQIIIDDTDATDTPRLRFRESGTTSGSIFTDASDLIFDTGTTERVRITSAGKVGIGTGASPLDTLHVVGTGRITSAVLTPLLKSGDGADNITIQGGNSGGANIELYGESHASFANKSFYDAETHSFRTANGLSTKLFIDSSAGNVGIGTTMPNSALEVSGAGAEIIINDTTTSRPQLNFYNSGSSHGRIYADSYELRFETSGNGMRLDALGRVGIGTTYSPNSILEISSTTSGVIMPRMNTTEMNAISSPTNGEMIYNTSVNKFYGYANGSWVALH
jgi:hypothetical protein